MLSRLLKPVSKDVKRKGSKDDFQEQLSQVGHEDISIPHTPRTPRLERARNLRWHLIELDKFEDVPRRSVSSYSIASDNSHHEPLSASFLESMSLDDIHNKRVQPPLPPLESSPENTSKRTFCRPRTQCQHPHTSDEHDDSYGTSSEYSGGSSAGSPPKNVEEEVAGFGRNKASSLAPRTRKKVNVQRRLQANGLDKLATVSVCPPIQEKLEVFGPGSPLPVPASTKVQSETEHKDLTSPTVSPRPSDATWAIPCQNKGIPNNRSGPLWLQERVDTSPYRSPRKSPLQSPLQSPKRSPISSPKMTSGVISPQHDHHPANNENLQNAHPLPLPWAANAVPVSPRSGTSSADRSEDYGRSDLPTTPRRQLYSPGRSDVAASFGRKWMKGALLGSGSFGKVYRGHHCETGELCAIKEVEVVPDDPRSKESAKQLAQEVALLSTLRHPNILHYKGSEMVGESLYIYLELVSGGSVYRLLQEFSRFSEPVIRRYTRQVLLGLHYLHGKNTVHRDIKCANLLVDQDGKVKLADFGMAKIIGKETAPLSFKGSPYWMAPEVILQNNTGFECAVDIWSLGCTVIEMATGKPPWFQYEGYAAMFKVMNSHDTPIPKSLSPMGQHFVSLCLQRDPSKRPSATKLLEHPFVQIDKVMSRPKDSEYFVGDSARIPREFAHSPARSTLNSPRDISSGTASPRQSRQAHIPISKSALQLSDYARPRPSKGGRRPGPLTDTEDYSYDGSPLRHTAMSSNKIFVDACGLHEAGNGNHDLHAREAYTPKN